MSDKFYNIFFTQGEEAIQIKKELQEEAKNSSMEIALRDFIKKHYKRKINYELREIDDLKDSFTEHDVVTKIDNFLVYWSRSIPIVFGIIKLVE